MIERNQAIEIARKRSAENGCAFIEPLKVFLRRKWRLGTPSRFEIWTNASCLARFFEFWKNAGSRGTRARFVIDAKTGEILFEGYSGLQAMIEQDQAIEIARKRAAENNWGFAEPLHVVLYRYKWWSDTPSRFEIWTNALKRGGNSRFVIDAKTGEILSEAFMPY